MHFIFYVQGARCLRIRQSFTDTTQPAPRYHLTRRFLSFWEVFASTDLLHFGAFNGVWRGRSRPGFT